MDLSGPIPSEIGALTSLTGLHLYNNALTGPIPPEIGALTSLTGLGLQDNALWRSNKWMTSKDHSSWRGVWTDSSTNYVLDLDQFYNKLTGYIPSEIAALTSLQRLDLYENDITGPIPSEIAALWTHPFRNWCPRLSDHLSDGFIPI
uniref:L domain-like protein n=1 Tax=Chaetoceros debilis TaxID=122233 RepID=A0A7S3QBV8_9STRA